MKGNDRKKEKKKDASDKNNKVLTEYQREKARNQPDAFVIKTKL